MASKLGFLATNNPGPSFASLLSFVDPDVVTQAFQIKFSFHALQAYEDQGGIVVTKKMILNCIAGDFCQKLKAKLKSFSRKAAGIRPSAAFFDLLREESEAKEEGREGGRNGGRDAPFEAVVEVEHESLRKIPMLELCEKICIQCFVNETAGVDTADRIAMGDKAGLLVQGRTVNLLDSLLRNCHLVDLTSLESNDIHMVQDIFGIEAARRVLENEVMKVFGAYGIEVDPRHLSLVSDFMTHTMSASGSK